MYNLTAIYNDERELSKFLQSLAEKLNGASMDWKDRTEALESIRKVFENSELDLETLSAISRCLREPLVSQLQDLRSAIVKEACATVAEMAEKFGRHFSPFAESCIDACLKLTMVTIKVMSESGSSCMERVIRCTHVGFPRVLGLILRSCTERSNILRRNAVTCMTLALQTWKPGCFARKQNEIEVMFVQLLRDADAMTRGKTRSCFTVYRMIFPDRASILLMKLDDGTKKLLATTKPLALHYEAGQSPTASLPSPNSAPKLAKPTRPRTNLQAVEKEEPAMKKETMMDRTIRPRTIKPKVRKATDNPQGAMIDVPKVKTKSREHQPSVPDMQSSAKHDANEHRFHRRQVTQARGEMDSTEESRFAPRRKPVIPTRDVDANGARSRASMAAHAPSRIALESRKKPSRRDQVVPDRVQVVSRGRAPVTNGPSREPIVQSEVKEFRSNNSSTSNNSFRSLLKDATLGLGDSVWSARVSTLITFKNTLVESDQTDVARYSQKIVSMLAKSIDDVHYKVVSEALTTALHLFRVHHCLLLQDLDQVLPSVLSRLQDSKLVVKKRTQEFVNLLRTCYTADDLALCVARSCILKAHRINAGSLHTLSVLVPQASKFCTSEATVAAVLHEVVSTANSSKIVAQKKASVQLILSLYRRGREALARIYQKLSPTDKASLQQLIARSDPEAAEFLSNDIVSEAEPQVVEEPANDQQVQQTEVQGLDREVPSDPTPDVSSSPGNRGFRAQLQRGHGVHSDSKADTVDRSEQSPYGEQQTSEMTRTEQLRPAVSPTSPNPACVPGEQDRFAGSPTRASPPVSPLELEPHAPAREQVFSKLKLGNSNERYLALKVIQRHVERIEGNDTDNDAWRERVLLALIDCIKDIQVINAVLACKLISTLVRNSASIVEEHFSLCFHSLLHSLSQFTFSKGLEVSIRETLQELFTKCSPETCEQALLELLLQEKEKKLALCIEFTSWFLKNSNANDLVKSFHCFFSSLCQALESPCLQVRKEAVMCFAVANKIVGPRFKTFLDHQAIDSAMRSLILRMEIA